MQHKPASSCEKPTPDGDAVTKEFVLSVFDRYQPKLTAYATRRCRGDVHAAKDAVQHTFMQLCKQRQAAVEQNTAAWLYSTCRNRIVDEHRRAENRNGSLAPGWDSADANAIDPAVDCEQRDLSKRLRRLVERLPDDQREVIDLWCHGFDSAEIASITEQKPGTVRVKLHRAIKRLQQHPEVLTWLERATGQRNSGDKVPLSRDGGPMSRPRLPSSTTGEKS